MVAEEEKGRGAIVGQRDVFNNEFLSSADI